MRLALLAFLACVIWGGAALVAGWRGDMGNVLVATHMLALTFGIMLALLIDRKGHR